MTGIEIAQTALSNLNTYEYLFGAKGEVMTSAGIENLIAMYPGYFSTDAKKVAARAKAGKACLDCSGFVTICSDMPVMGSWQLRESAAERRTLEQMDGAWKAGGRYIPVGAILWKAGHVGIYVGNQKVAEAQSEELNLNLNPMDGRGFTECLLFSSVNYDENTSDLQAQASAPSSSEYIPWIGKVVNTVSVMPSTSPSANGAASPIGMLENGALVRVMSLNGNYYCIRSSSGFYGYVNTYFIGSTAAPAFDSQYAEWTGRVEGADNHVNVRVAPSVSASLHSIYPQLVNGTEVLVYSEVLGNDDLRLWYAVEITSGVTGYVRADLVKPSVYVSYSAWIGKAASTTGTVNIRTAPTVNSSLSSLHAPLSNGDTVTVIGETIGSDGYRWYTVSLDGIRVGYCRSDLIIPDYDDYYETWEAVILASTGSANVRTGPGTSYSIVTGSPYTNGTIIQVIGEVTGSDGYVWYHITVGNMYYGYIRSDLAEPSLSYIPWKVIANPPTANLNIRSGAGTNYDLSEIISSVPKGKEMTVTGQICGTDLNIWYKVYVDGVYGGYVRSDLVTPVMTKSYTEWTGEANSTTGTVNVRSEASTNSEVISEHPQMTNGDTCVVYGQVEGADGRIWYRVRILGQYFGYVRSDLISRQITSSSRLGYAKWNGILQGSSQNVNIRYDAGTGYAITAALPNGTAVEVINTKNGTDGYVWYQVRTAEAAGYARSDLVFHAGDTIGDDPYTILPWSGRCKTERQQFVYDAPFISLEGATVVRENSFFIILRKVFDRNGESWYHMRSEDGLTDGNGLLLVCYTKVNDVYTFPKLVDCDDDLNDPDGHSYIYPESDILQMCEKCGRHIIYKKPSKTFVPSNVLTTMSDVDNLPELNDNTLSSYQNRVIDYSLFLQIMQDIETGYYNYYTNVFLPLLISEGLYQDYNKSLIGMFCGLGRHGGYDDMKWNTILYGSSFDVGFVEYSEDYPRLDKELKLLSTANTTNTSAIVDLGDYGYLQWKHLMAVFNGYYGTSVLGTSTILPCLVPEYWTGWGGDLCTLAQDVDHSNTTNELLCAISLMGQTTASAGVDPIFGSLGSSFRYEDYIADIDAIGIAALARENLSNMDTHFFSTIVELYYTQHVSDRKLNLLHNILGIYNLDSLTVVDLAESLFTMITNQRVDISDMGSVAMGIYNALLDTQFLSLLFFISMNWEEQTLNTPSESILIAVCLAFAKYILTEE